MNVAVVGTGYVGLVTGTCLAEKGNEVVCIDNNPDKVNQMQLGEIPIYEPDLENIFQRNIKEKRLTFTSDLAQGIVDADVIFLALPTPEAEDGSADLSYVLGVAKELGPLLTKYTVIVDKSTVPVGTARKVRGEIEANAKPDTEFDVVSNPEFLKEGQAVADFMKPDRIVVGTSSERAWQRMRKLYKPFVLRDESKLIKMSEESAELTKYAANAMLAAKITFMNSMANLCELAGADVREVQRGIGSDERIGDKFLHAGPGYGGSCFPKDVQALQKTAKELGYDFSMLDAIHETNMRQKLHLVEMIEDHFDGDIEGKIFAMWGLAFKANTDDIRESAALDMIHALTEKGGRVRAFDPQAMDNVRKQEVGNKSLEFTDDQYQALEGADALVLVTDWDEFQAPNFTKIKKLLKQPLIFDGRSLFDLEEMTQLSIQYASIGRLAVNIS